MPYIEKLDDSAWPIVYARFRGTATIAEVTTYLEWYQGCLDRARLAGQQIAAINDTTPGVTVSPEVRKFIADWLGKIGDTNAIAIANIVVVDSAIMRGVLTALRWVSPKAVDGVITAPTVEAAWQTALERLKAHGVAPPARVASWSQPARRA